MGLYSRLGTGILVALVSCSPSDPADPCATFPSAPAGAAHTLFVAVDCLVQTPDGSQANPFHRITDAVAAAEPDTVILVAPGVYEENLKIERKQPLTIVGASDLSRPVEGGVVLRAPGNDSAIFIIGPGGGVPDKVALRGIRVESPSTAGIWAHQAVVEVEACSVTGPKKVEGQYGFGVLATGGSVLTMKKTEVSDAALLGVHLSASSATLEGCTIRDNAAGGVRADLCPDPGLVLTGNVIRDNTGLGVGVFSSKARFVANTITGTKQDASGAADGLVASVLMLTDGGAQVAQAPSDVDIGDDTAEGANTFDANERVGILLDAGTTARVVRNVATGSGRAGIWLQGTAGGADGEGAVVRANRVEGNSYLGIGLTGGSRATVSDNDVGGTRLGTTFIAAEQVELAYDVGLFSGSWASVAGNRFSPFADAGDHAVAQVLADDVAGGTSIRSNTWTGTAGGFRIVTQALANGVSVAADGNEGAEVLAIPAGQASPYRVDSGMTDGVSVALPQGLIGPGGGVPD